MNITLPYKTKKAIDHLSSYENVAKAEPDKVNT